MTKLDSYCSDNSYSCFPIELLCQTKTFTQFERLNRYTGTYHEMVNLYILINIERVSKHFITILGLDVVTHARLEPG